MTAEGYFSQVELEAGLPEVHRSPDDGGTLVQIVVRPDTELRELPQSCTVTPEAGIPADRWGRYCKHQLPDGRLNPETQLTLMNSRCLALVAGNRDRWPLAGDNLLVDLDLSEANLPTGQRLKIGEAILEITAKPHTGCSKFLKKAGRCGCAGFMRKLFNRDSSRSATGSRNCESLRTSASAIAHPPPDAAADGNGPGHAGFRGPLE
jgi:hypothetical protein